MANTIQTTDRTAERRTGDRASQRVELLPKREILEDQFVMSSARQGQRADEEKDHLKHARILTCYARGINSRSCSADFGE